MKMIPRRARRAFVAAAAGTLAVGMSSLVALPQAQAAPFDDTLTCDSSFGPFDYEDTFEITASGTTVTLTGEVGPPLGAPPFVTIDADDAPISALLVDADGVEVVVEQTNYPSADVPGGTNFGAFEATGPAGEADVNTLELAAIDFGDWFGCETVADEPATPFEIDLGEVTFACVSDFGPFAYVDTLVITGSSDAPADGDEVDVTLTGANGPPFGAPAFVEVESGSMTATLSGDGGLSVDVTNGDYPSSPINGGEDFGAFEATGSFTAEGDAVDPTTLTVDQIVFEFAGTADGSFTCTVTDEGPTDPDPTDPDPTDPDPTDPDPTEPTDPGEEPTGEMVFACTSTFGPFDWEDVITIGLSTGTPADGETVDVTLSAETGTPFLAPAGIVVDGGSFSTTLVGEGGLSVDITNDNYPSSPIEGGNDMGPFVGTGSFTAEGDDVDPTTLDVNDVTFIWEVLGQEHEIVCSAVSGEPRFDTLADVIDGGGDNGDSDDTGGTGGDAPGGSLADTGTNSTLLIALAALLALQVGLVLMVRTARTRSNLQV